jgi:hypothetical protein
MAETTTAKMLLLSGSNVVDAFCLPSAVTVTPHVKPEFETAMGI